MRAHVRTTGKSLALYPSPGHAHISGKSTLKLAQQERKKVEEAFKEHKWHDAYKYLKALGAGQEASVNTIKGPDGTALTSPELIHAAWKEFFELLLNCQREIPEGVYEGLPVHPNTDPLAEHAPIRQEVVWGLQAVLNYKGCGGL